MMTIRFIILIFSIAAFANGIPAAVHLASSRVRRELGQFGSMVECTNGIDPIKFVGYGCYCGFGGEGEPLDHIDRCCQEHDLCYQKAVTKKQCPSSYFTYIVYYRYDCSGCGTIDANIQCRPARSYPWIKVNAVCAAEICECDRTAAQCFSEGYINQAYRNYDKSTCNTTQEIGL